MILALLLACAGSDDSAASGSDAPSCGDADGGGTDTGDIPDVLGTWTSTFGSAFWDDNCATANLDQGTETWVGAFYVEGTAPDAFYVYFGTAGSPDTDRFYGAIDRFGGITISGRYAHSAGTLHASFGGLLYHDPNLDRDTINGAGSLGLDADGDGAIDCVARGSWTAFKSG
jgi:hypothetical protein